MADDDSALAGADASLAEAFRGIDAGSLAETATLLASVVESTPSAVFAKNLVGEYLLVNSTAARLLTVPREEILGHTDAMLFPPDIAELYGKWDRRVLETGQTISYEEEAAGFETGEWRFRLVNKGPIRDKDGKIVGVVGVVRDITEAKATEKVLADVAKESGLLATFGMALMACRSDEDVFSLVEAFFNEVLPQYVVLINQTKPDGRSTVLRRVLGLEESLLGKASKLLGFEFAGREFAVNAEFRARYSSTNLTRIEGGFAEFAGGEVSGAASKAIEKAFGFKDVYTVAIADEAREYCSVHIITKQPDEVLPSLLIDAFVRQCFLAFTVIDRARNLELSLSSVIDVVSRTVEMRDPYTAGHQRRVTTLATSIARSCGMSEADIEDIRVASLMHDVGKISIPAEVLSKPGRLSSMEYELVKLHAEAGYEIVRAARMKEPIAELIFQHHEREDGSGYPRGLSGDDLLPGAKVLIVADVVEAMASHRPYRPSVGLGPAVDEITQNAGRLYDPKVVEACVELLEHGFDFDSEAPGGFDADVE